MFEDKENIGSASLFNANDVRRLLRCSLPLVYKMAQRGQLPCVKWECPGKGNEKQRTMIRFKREDVFDFIEKHYQTI